MLLNIVVYKSGTWRDSDGGRFLKSTPNFDMISDKTVPVEAQLLICL